MSTVSSIATNSDRFDFGIILATNATHYHRYITEPATKASSLAPKRKLTILFNTSEALQRDISTILPETKE